MNYVVDFMILIIIYFLLFYNRWKQYSIKRLLLNTLLYVYISIVLFLTIMPFQVPQIARHTVLSETINFMPFRDVVHHYKGAIREVILNIVMMIPFGFLYAMIKQKGLGQVILITLFFSLSLECIQLLSTWSGSPYVRRFDVTDLITNTAGGMVGYLLYCLSDKLIIYWRNR